MTVKHFLNDFIYNLPSRGVDDTEIYLCLPLEEDEIASFRITRISNDGTNDGIFIYIEEVK